MTAVGTAWEMHDDPLVEVVDGIFRPRGALTVEGSRFFDCASPECRGKGPRPFPMRHTAKLGSVYWTCTGCDETRESTPCMPEDFPFDPAPATPETAKFAVRAGQCQACDRRGIREHLATGTWWCAEHQAEPVGTPDVRAGVECSSCHREQAVMTAYFSELGKSAQLLPWCSDCLTTHAGLIVAAGYPLTLLPLDPIPGYHELRAQLDRIQRGDGKPVDTHAEARAAVQRFEPYNPDKYGQERRSPHGRKPGEWK